MTETSIGRGVPVRKTYDPAHGELPAPRWLTAGMGEPAAEGVSDWSWPDRIASGRGTSFEIALGNHNFPLVGGPILLIIFVRINGKLI